MDLRALSDFVIITESRGFTAAERRSGQPKSTLSRRIRELEESLGARVFDRNSRALRLTAEGELLYARARGPLDELAEAEHAVRAASSEPQGLLRLSAPVLFAEFALGPILADYLSRNPAVRIDLVTQNRGPLPIEEGFDLVIQVNPGDSNDLVGRCIMRDVHYIVAAPALVAKYAGDAAAIWPSITIKDWPESLWRTARSPEGFELRHQPVLQTTSMAANYHAALAGAGVAKIPSFMAKADVDAGRLVRLEEEGETGVEIWALHLSRRLASRKVISFIDHLVASFPDAIWPAGQ